MRLKIRRSSSMLVGRRCGVFLILLFLLGGSWGCAHTISSEMRRRAARGVTFPMVLRDPDAYVGTTVIWGGIIIETVNRPGQTEIAILETPLDWEEMPQDEEYTRGRFLAIIPSYLDPEVYRRGRKVTLAGEVAGKEVRPLGETRYVYPKVRVREMHLWREVVRYPLYPSFWWGWYGYPYPPYYFGLHYGYW
jgi:outer membrane lipoprotein